MPLTSRPRIKGFKAFLQQRQAEIEVADVDEAAALMGYFFNFMLLGLLLHGDETLRQPVPPLHSRDAYAHSVATIAYRYLTFPE